MNKTGRNQTNKVIVNRLTFSQHSKKLQKDEFDRWGTYTERFALLVSIIVAFVTLSLFVITMDSINLNIKSTSAATRAADAADRTYNLQKEDYQLQNQAFLQLSKPKIEFSRIDNFPTLSFTINNLKSEPAKIISSSSFFFEDLPKNKALGSKEYERIEKKYDTLKYVDNATNIYVVKETPAELNYTVYQKIHNDTLILLRNGKLDVYLFGQFLYYNLLTNTLSQYKFGIEFLGYNPNEGYRFLYSDNLPYQIK